MRIDTRITLDFAQARLQESLLGVLLAAAPFGGVPYTDAGINQYDAAASDTFGRLVGAGHFLGGFIVPAGQPDQGVVTPAVFAPLLSSLTGAQRASRTLTLRGLAYTREAIERVVFNVQVRR